MIRIKTLLTVILLMLAICSGCSRTELPVVSMLRDADKAFESGDYGRAYYLYYQLRQHFPYMQNIRISLGYTYLKLDWNPYAGGEFSKALELSADTNAAAWVGLGIYYSRTQDWDTAIICFSHARSYAPDQADIYRNLGNAFYYNREYSQAAKNYDHAAALGDRSDSLYTAIGLSYERNTQWTDAVKAYEKAYALNDKNIQAVYRLHVLYRDRYNNLHKTKMFYDRLKILAPKIAQAEKPVTEYVMANTYVTNPNITFVTSSQNVAEVTADTNAPPESVDPALAKKTSWANRYEMLAKASLSNDLPQTAIKQYIKALENDPERGYINKDLAIIYEKQLDDLNLAIKYFERYLNWCKNDDEKFRTTVAYVNILRDKYNAQEAGKRQDILDEEQRKKAELAELERQKEIARLQDIATSKKEPQTYNEVIEKGAEYLRAEKKNLGEARRLFQKAITINSAYPNAYYNIGLIHVMETNFTEAISYFNVALKKNPDFAKSHLALGAVYDRLAKRPEAIEHYTMYLELAPNTSFSESVKQWLARNAGAQ